MLSRGFAVASILAVASIAQAGATVRFVIDPPPCSGDRLLLNTEYTVHVELLQDVDGGDQRLRMIELDLAQSSPFLVLTLPTTHTLDTIVTSDDIHFWSFNSVQACLSTPSFCGFNHHIDDDMPAGAVDTRTNVLSATFFGLAVDGTAQMNLIGGPRPPALRVGTFLMTPTIVGSATLNVMNAADADPNRRARIDFGFDPHITWRASATPSATSISGGVRPFEIVTQCDEPPALVSSVPAFTTFGVATVPALGTLWRSAGNVVRLTFDGALPGAPAAGQLLIQEMLAGGLAGPDLSASFAVSLESGNTVLRLRDGLTTTPTATLLHRKWYVIRNTGGWAGVANFVAEFPSQVGDATGDNRSLQADILEINTGISCLSGCGDQNRKDVTGDGRVLQSDILETNTRISSLPVAKPSGW